MKYVLDNFIGFALTSHMVFELFRAECAGRAAWLGWAELELQGCKAARRTLIRFFANWVDLVNLKLFRA